MSHTPDDEVLSAMLDGEAAAADIAHVEGCDACQARLNILRVASEAVQARIALPPPHVREAAVARAMQSTAVRGDAPGPVRRLNALSAAAVLVVALAVGGLAITQIGRGQRAERNDLATAGAASDQLTQPQLNTKSLAPPGNAPSNASAGTTDAAETFAMQANDYDAGDIGRFRDINAIVSRAQGDLTKPADEQAVNKTHGATTTCPLPEDSTVLWEASLYYLDAPVTAIVRTAAKDRWVLELRSRDSSDCAVLASREFAPTTQR